MFLNFAIILLQEQPFLLRSEKIYSVMATIVVIFLAFIVYLVLTNRRLSALEKKMDELSKK